MEENGTEKQKSYTAAFRCEGHLNWDTQNAFMLNNVEEATSVAITYNESSLTTRWLMYVH